MRLEPIRQHVEAELARVAAQLHWTEKIEVLDFLGWSTAVVTGFAGQRLILGQQRAYPYMSASGTGDTIDVAALDYFWNALSVTGGRKLPVVEH